MISFSLLSPLVRALFALWALLLCLTDIGNAVLAAVKKRLKFTVFALLLLAPAYFLWQIIFDFSLFGKTEKAFSLTHSLCAVAWAYWLIAFVVLSIASAILFMLNIRYDRNYITSGTIKLFLDKMPCGICCWRENGRVLFSNICMNELCKAITGNNLLNGNQFHDAVKEEIITVSQNVWRFVCRDMEINGEKTKEMIAYDITAEYAKTQALKEDKAELSRLNRELWEYYASIDESVQRQEILQAKMNIHDEMNRLMLSTVAVDKNDPQALDNIFSLWEQNALLLCLESEVNSTKQQLSTVDSLAKALGINLIWRENPPNNLSDEQKELVFRTAQEAIINAVKHAGAKNMEVSFEQTEAFLLCRFSNDGALPENEVHFAGGLANLARLAREQNASLKIEVDEKFTVILII